MVSSETSRSTRRRCSVARDGTDARTALKVPGVVGQDGRQPGQQPADVLVATGPSGAPARP